MRIEPSKQFQPTKHSVGVMLAAYNLSLISFRQAQTGIENCTLFVTTDGGEYVLRVYRQSKKSDASVVAEHEFIKYLGEHNIPVVPTIQPSAGGYVAKYEDWQAILMPKILGAHSPAYTPRLIKNLAVVQARMHLLAGGYNAGISAGNLLNTLRDTVFLPNVNVADLDAAAQSLLERAANYSVALPKGLPAGLCHLDYDTDNVLVDGNDSVAAVLDFDDVALAPFVVCLSYTLWHIMAQEHIDLVHEYLGIYRSYRELNEQELSVIPSIMLFRHYVIAAHIAQDGGMDRETADKYIRVERAMLNWHPS